MHNSNVNAAGDGLTLKQRLAKRILDIFLSGLGLLCTAWIILPAFILASIDTRASGFFVQQRVGYRGRLFPLLKIRTMRPGSAVSTTVTTAADPRITRMGKFWRKTKIDELPQLVNILLGQMSFVGPRPDVPGFADQLCGDDRIILSVRPGITGPATLSFHNEESILKDRTDPEKYNQEVIYPEKVRLNKEYVQNYSFWKDLAYIVKTLLFRFS